MTGRIRILDIVHDTTVDGPGFRTGIYCAGCGHSCKGCHNPESWDFHGGREVTVDELMQEIVSDEFAQVTFTGGDPMYQADGFLELCHRIKAETCKTVWCYTGFTWEAIHRRNADDAMVRLAELVDVLVDGPFILEQRDTDLLFRGSSNQRLIDVKASLGCGDIVLWERS